ncbi:MAG: FkbM family methyltransferase [Oligoflexia bacterium]|nr:FkbM family methyltransferase [Oligoflexia bacterium]
MKDSFPNTEIVNVADCFKIFASNELEKYRAETLFTKEPETTEWIKTFFQNSENFLDIGANIGIYSLYAAFLYSDMTVIGVEPFQPNFSRFVENINLNRINNIFPLQLAFSREDSIKEFFSSDLRIGASGGQFDSNVDESGVKFEVKNIQRTISIKGDSFFKAFPLITPNHIKIDVDGNEESIIEGMTELLESKKIKSILIELNPIKSNSDTVKNILNDLGFSEKNKYNLMNNHSRNRRRSKGDTVPENIIFIRTEYL